MIKIFILMRNDSPERAYTNEETARAEQKKEQHEADKEIHFGQMRSYWHIRDVPLVGEEMSAAAERMICEYDLDEPEHGHHNEIP